MVHSFETVDYKVSEVDFFLGKMISANRNWSEFSYYLSAFLSASRSVTLALQHFKSIPDFNDWYDTHQSKLKSDPLARFMLKKRNDHVHGGPIPIAGAMFYQGKSKYRFEGQEEDVVSCCRNYFIELLKIVYDCYVALGVYFDPQQYYTKEHFAKADQTIDDAELEIWGWIMTSHVEEGYDEDDRWHELRGRVGECPINHLFKGYLDKVTPQPIEPEHFADFDLSDEEKGWNYIPHGFNSIEEYMKSVKK
ncbi:hypothetical protein [Reichenbachiella sp.]|uniref:hypothetical protein n=1 Tax=Reichenbachiella sp. TaxID=2184521 RepID=UPI003297CBA8